MLWITIIIIGLLTLATRLSFILFWERLTLTPRMEIALRFVPIAVLSAIILPALVQHNTILDLSLHNARLIAGICAIIVAWRTRNTLLTIACGMGILWIIQVLVH